MKNILLISTVILFISCSVNHKKECEQNLVDPFKLYSPNFHLAREQNDVFQEWVIHNPILGVHKYLAYNKITKDSVICVMSGNEALGVAWNFAAYYTYALPVSAKKIFLNLEYQYVDINDSELNLKLIFRNKTDVLDSVIFALPEMNKKDTSSFFSNFKTLLSIPENSNNFKIIISTKIGQVILSKCEI